MTKLELAEIKQKLCDLAPEFAATVAPLYVILNWTWESGDKAYIPGKRQIESCLKSLIDSLSDEWLSDGTGGLEVFIRDENQEDGPGDYGFRFVLEEWQSL